VDVTDSPNVNTARSACANAFEFGPHGFASRGVVTP